MKRASMSSRTVFRLGVAALAAALAIPAVAAAQDYDGYCYQKKHDAGTNGLVAGAIIGGAVGSNAGRDSVKCYNGEYYSYDSGYYDPPPAPDGYSVVYFHSRPSSSYYDRVERRAYSDGYRDGSRDRRNGWYDSDGYWHDGPR